MTVAEAKLAAAWGEARQVLRWRVFELRRAGYEAEQAIRLANDPAVDLHRACDLLACGCEPETALRILL
jgi:hypothetical protein